MNDKTLTLMFVAGIAADSLHKRETNEQYKARLQAARDYLNEKILELDTVRKPDEGLS